MCFYQVNTFPEVLLVRAHLNNNITSLTGDTKKFTLMPNARFKHYETFILLSVSEKYLQIIHNRFFSPKIHTLFLLNLERYETRIHLAVVVYNTT